MKKKTKFRLAFVTVLCALLLTAAGVCTARLNFRRGNPNKALYGRDIAFSGSMTPQDRTADFAELCGFLEKNAPILNEFEELYGISYESIKTHYKALAENAETDYDYYACLTGFMNNIPSSHTAVGFPSARLADDNMEYWLLQNKSFISAQEHWLDIIHAECAEHYGDSPAKMVFSYYSGEYIGAALPSDDDIFGVNKAVLLSVNGVPADSFIAVFSSTYKLKYDHAAGKPFRDSIIFNDSFGEPCEVEYRTADGAVKTASLYCGAGSEICLNYAEYFRMIDGIAQTEDTPKAAAQNAASVLRDDKNGIATVFVNSFDSDTVNGKAIAGIIKTVSADFDNIIIDIRSNTGGYYEYAYDVLSALSPKDIEISDSIFCTEDSFKRNGNIFDFKRGENGMYSYTEKVVIKGETTGNKNLYLLVSDSTCSAADLLASEFSKNKLGTVVGINNTGGEKNGTVRVSFCTVSGIYFYYTEYDSLNPDGTSSGVYGTAPDVWLNADAENYFIREQLKEQGEDIYSPENRLKWDGVLRQVYELIKSSKADV